MRWASLVVGALLAGCSIEHALVSCPGDTLCPVGYVCEPVHGGCALPEQLEVCVGVADGERCIADTVIGYCLDAICIDPTCGNRVVDPGEICDDGNRENGDGCNATCVSAERCGDGATDPVRGEECDDGNLISRDGCDSRCMLEIAEWSVDELGPSSAVEDWMTWDPVRARMVMVADGFVWGWDGTRWAVITDDAPVPDGDYDVTFDVARSRLVVLTIPPQEDDILVPNPPRSNLWEWDGSTWTNTTLSNAIAVGRNPDDFAIAYDPVRMAVFGFGIESFDPGTRHAGALDLATGMWKTIAPPAGTYYPGEGFDVTFDEARGVVVLVTGGTANANPVVHEWNGTGWTSTGVAMAKLSRWTIAYDAMLQRVIAVGGYSSTSGTDSPVQSWNGSTWSTLTAVSDVRSQPGVVFDRVRQVRVVFGGSSLGARDEVAEWDGTAWRIPPRNGPTAGADDLCASDEQEHRIVCTGVPGVNGPRETWALVADRWMKLAFEVPDMTGAMTWDPIRRAIVAWGILGPFAIVGEGVQPIATAGPVLTGIATAMAFDPVTQDLVLTTVQQFGGHTETVRLRQDGTFEKFDSRHFVAIAYDARNASIVGLDSVGLFRLVGQTWERVVGPATGFTMVSNARKGTVEFISPGLGVLEHVGTSWNELPGKPPRAVVGEAVVDQFAGELYVLGKAGTFSRFILHRRWNGSGALETCTAGNDVDEDGLVQCDDEDCWDSCDACPPYTTCL